MRSSRKRLSLERMDEHFLLWSWLAESACKLVGFRVLWFQVLHIVRKLTHVAHVRGLILVGHIVSLHRRRGDSRSLNSQLSEFEHVGCLNCLVLSASQFGISIRLTSCWLMEFTLAYRSRHIRLLVGTLLVAWFQLASVSFLPSAA